MGVLLGDRIGAQPLAETRQRMGHGRDAGRVGAVELADQVDDSRQALLVHRDLGRLQLEAGQVSDALDLRACEGHRGEEKGE